MSFPKDKTKNELDLIKNNFFILVDAFDQINLDYFVDSGTLLGMYRNGDFIKWDWDVEFSITDQKFEENKIEILKIIKKKGFEICKIDKINKKIDFIKDFEKSVNKFSIKVWKFNKSKNIYFRNNFEIPKIYFDKTSNIECFGRNFKAPNMVEEYLTFMYGDWRIPLKSAEKSKYLSKSYYKRNLLSRIKNFILGKIKN